MKSQALILGVFLMAAIVLSGCTTAQQGPQGPAGSQGLQGPAGTQGKPGISAYEIVTKSVIVRPDTYFEFEAICPSGKKIIGGGCSIPTLGEDSIGGTVTPSDQGILESYPESGKWICHVRNAGRAADSIKVTKAVNATAYAICANVES